MKSLHAGTGDGVYGSAAISISPVVSRYKTLSSPRLKGNTSQPTPEEDPIDKGSNSRAESQAQGFEDEEVYKTPFSAIMNAEIDALMERLQANVVVKDRAVTTPLFVQVPRGCQVESSLSPSRFYRSRIGVKEHVKKRKRGDETTTSSRLKMNAGHDRHGFRPQEVNMNGAVHLEDCRPSNLTNEIHPLFDHSCFDDVPDAIYEQLIPGLQLATMFLTQPICMQFWVTLAYGDRQDDPEQSKENGKWAQRIASHVPLTSQNTSDIIELLEGLGKSRLVHFRFKQKLAGTKTMSGAWGLSDPICDYKGIQKEAHGQKSSLIRSIIRIHADYYIVAKRLSQLKYSEVSQKLRFSFMFATLIVHELAHTIEGIHIRYRAEQWINWQTSRLYKEPYWLGWTHPEHGSELGRAWEETMFGGEVAPINDRVDGSHGVCTTDWPPRGTKNDPERRIWFTVSMGYIENMFQGETWQQDFDLSDWRVFNIPRDGAISLYLNYFTTMSWDQVQRLAEEEEAEWIDLENQKPATKKRIIGEGKAEEHRSGNEDDAGPAGDGQDADVDTPKQEKGQVLSAQGIRSRFLTLNCSNKTRRLILSPETRKRSPKSVKKRSKTKVMTLIAKTSFTANEVTPLQQGFPQSQRAKDRERRLRDSIAEQKSGAKPKMSKEPMSEIVKKIRSRPAGLADRRRQRRKAEREKRRVESKRKEEGDGSLKDEPFSDFEEYGELGVVGDAELKDGASGMSLSTPHSDAEIQEAGNGKADV
ncbi:hypothetical protein MMC21_001608 [Puttea exsequens]|nr:hypothetical protein [Puttea exsequens]